MSLLDAAIATPHDHRQMRHPQTGNPFYDWWSCARFQCDLCLAVMRERDQDIAVAFTRTMPYRIEHRHDRDWWRAAYLLTLRYVADRDDREWMRDQLADATRRGRPAPAGTGDGEGTGRG